MKALVFDKTLSLKDVPFPARKTNEALVRVLYAGICATDIEITKGYMGFSGIPGHEFVGMVEDADDKALIGKRATGEINFNCKACDFCNNKGLSNHCPNRSVLGILNKDGAFAEYLTMPQDKLHVIPDEVSDIEAVFTEPLAAAFEIIEQIAIAPQDSVLVIGDGRLAQLCAQVVSLCNRNIEVLGRHPEKLKLLEDRGIRTHLDGQDLGRNFDVVIEASGAATGLQRALELIKPKGTIVLKTTVTKDRTIDFNRVVIDEVRIIGSRCGPFGPAINALKDKSVEVGQLVSRVFPLSDGIEAFNYARQKGVMKVLIKM